MQVLLSVITPAFNAERTIAETIESVRALGAGVEHIVIDDGSTDGTADIVRKYGGTPRLMAQPNRGMSASRNRAIAEAKGEWVLFLDADDLVEPNLLALLIDAIAQNPDADVHYGHFWVVDDDGSNRSYAAMDDISQGPLPLLLRHNRLGILATICRTKIVRKVDGFDENLPSSADWDLWIRIAAAGGKFNLIPEPISVYRMTAGSASKQFWRMWNCLRLIQQKHGALIAQVGNPRAIVRDQAERLLDRDLRYVYGPDQDTNWISRRMNRTKKVVQLCSKDPQLVPYFTRRMLRKITIGSVGNR